MADDDRYREGDRGRHRHEGEPRGGPGGRREVGQGRPVSGGYDRERGDRGRGEGEGGYGGIRGSGDQGGRGPGQDDIGAGAYGRGYVGNQGRGYGYGYGGEGQGDRNAQAYDEAPEDRGWLARTTDEVASWFGDEDAGRRREGDHRGRGPKGYKRSDERITEDVNDRLYDDSYVDASDIDVTVSAGEVTLAGTVDSRDARRRAEDIAERVSGVTYVQNNLRVARQGSSGTGSSTSGTGAGRGTGSASAVSGTGPDPDSAITEAEELAIGRGGTTIDGGPPSGPAGVGPGGSRGGSTGMSATGSTSSGTATGAGPVPVTSGAPTAGTGRDSSS